MDDNCGEWVECMGVHGEQERGVACWSGWNLLVWLAGGGCGWNLWVWLVGVFVRKYIDFLKIITYPYSSCSYLFFFAAVSLLFVHF